MDEPPIPFDAEEDKETSLLSTSVSEELIEPPRLLTKRSYGQTIEIVYWNLSESLLS